MFSRIRNDFELGHLSMPMVASPILLSDDRRDVDLDPRVRDFKPDHHQRLLLCTVQGVAAVSLKNGFGLVREIHDFSRAQSRNQTESDERITRGEPK